MNKRVGVIGLLHESNTFIESKTTLQHFEDDMLAVGDQVRVRFEDAAHEIGGFFEGLCAAGIDAVPIFAARAIPFGPVASDAYRVLLERMLSALDNAGQLDGVLAAPHGATVSERVADVDGDWLSLVRERVGAGTPIIATIDPHANVSAKMIDATDALIAYRTNPHLDQRERGLEAAGLMALDIANGQTLEAAGQADAGGDQHPESEYRRVSTAADLGFGRSNARVARRCQLESCAGISLCGCCGNGKFRDRRLSR